MNHQSLFNGYNQVESFGADDVYETRSDGEIEEEEVYVTLDLGAVEPTLVPSTSEYRLIGLDTPTPYLQLSGTIFKGQHHSLLGTELLFSEGRDENADRNKKSIMSVGTTETRIRFCEVELKEKGNFVPQNIAPPTQYIDESSSQRTTQSSSRGRGRGKKGGTRGKSKGKGKAIDTFTSTPDSAPGVIVSPTEQPTAEIQEEGVAGDLSVQSAITDAMNEVELGPEPMEVDGT